MQPEPATTASLSAELTLLLRKYGVLLEAGGDLAPLAAQLVALVGGLKAAASASCSRLVAPCQLAVPYTTGRAVLKWAILCCIVCPAVGFFGFRRCRLGHIQFQRQVQIASMALSAPVRARKVMRPARR